MKGKKLLFLACLCFTAGMSFGQTSFLDSNINIPMVKMGFGIQFPGGDMKDRFGTNSNLEGEFAFKFRSNFYLGARGSFLFGRQVKEDDILNGIETTDGHVIDNGGELGTIYFDERGYSLFLVAGKLFPVFSPNKNSGLLITVGAGMLQHKIRIEYRDSRIAYLEPEYREGYDRLSNGLAVQAFVGYMFFSEYRLINFYAGFDYVQAWTENRRGFNFDTGEYDHASRHDILTGLKVGWILPLYKKKPDEFYFY